MDFVGYEDDNVIEIKFDLKDKLQREVYLFLKLMSNDERVYEICKMYYRKDSKMLYNLLVKIIDKINNIESVKDVEINKVKKESNIEIKDKKSNDKGIKKEIKVDIRKCDEKKEVKNDEICDFDDILDSFIDNGFK